MRIRLGATLLTTLLLAGSSAGLPGTAFDTPVLGGVVAGSVAGSEDVIVRTEPLSVPPKGGVSGSAVSSLRTAAAPAIPGCAA